jgi:hypothetical protein
VGNPGDFDPFLMSASSAQSFGSTSACHFRTWDYRVRTPIAVLDCREGENSSRRNNGEHYGMGFANLEASRF